MKPKPISVKGGKLVCDEINGSEVVMEPLAMCVLDRGRKDCLTKYAILY